MNTLQAIADRRSIRKFDPRPVPHELVERVIAAAHQAPSAKNGQPWRFVALEGEQHLKLAHLMRDRAAALKAAGEEIGSLAWTAHAMENASATVVVFHRPPPAEVPAQFHDDWQFVMLQSTGAAIQNMLLAALDLGLGSLWICDILYCADEVKEWLGKGDHTLIACVTLGYPAEAPAARPRLPLDQVVEWRS